jgi:dipeptidyl aminopeptidase/acylaminoacyl peptidase
MTATPARRFGPYEFIAPLGAGGMGEVFRARDTRLGRDVAIKVLPTAFSTDPERLRRFEQEARAAAALNHPAILAVYDIGTENGAPYIVSELLEGETVRCRLLEGALPLHTAIEYAAEIARGLAAAHEKGIVHRDLKPENIFLLPDGRVKILDFGLAKLVQLPVSAEIETQSIRRPDTTPGVVLGTVGYMSPEQVRGLAVDHRSDIFSFGAILYEMLSGERAFKRDTPADTMTAILKEDPPELTIANTRVPPALDLTVRRCMAKTPPQRFQSASDLAFNLEEISNTSSISAIRPPAPAPKMSRRLFFAIIGTVGAIVIAIGAFFLGHRSAPAPVLRYHQISYQQGTIPSARFSPDGQTIFYAARFGKKFEMYSGRLDSAGLHPLGIDAYQVLSVSPVGGIAFLESMRRIFGAARPGPLARVPLGGGAPKRVLDDVQSADWSRDGSELAVSHFITEKHVYRLEYPIGNTLYETVGMITNVRFSPDGKTLAFLDHPVFGDDQGFVAVIASSGGTVKHLTPSWSSLQGIAWRPDGRELWFTASNTSINRSLYAVTLSSITRSLQTVPGGVLLEDVASNGKVLLNHYDRRLLVMVSTAAYPEEQDLSWFDWPVYFRFSNDGKQVLLGDESSASGPNYSTYLRNVDGSAAVRLGDGEGLALSPDGKLAVSRLPQSPDQLLLLPTGAGEARKLTRSTLLHEKADWFPDSKRIVFTGGPARTYLLDLNGNETPLTPEGTTGTLVTPDSRYVLVQTREGKHELFPVTGGEPKPLDWLRQNDEPLRFSADGRFLFVATAEAGDPGRNLYRINFADGKRTLQRHIQPPQNAYSSEIGGIDVTPDGTGYAYRYLQARSTLYVVDGFR